MRRQHIAYYCNMLSHGQDAAEEPMQRIAASLSVGVAGRSQLVHRTRACDQLAHRRHTPRPARPSPSPRTAASPRIAVAHYGQLVHRTRALRPTCAQPSRIEASLRTAILEGQTASCMKPRNPRQAGATPEKPRTPQLVWCVRGRRARRPTLRGARESNRAQYPGSSHR